MIALWLHTSFAKLVLFCYFMFLFNIFLKNDYGLFWAIDFQSIMIVITNYLFAMLDVTYKIRSQIGANLSFLIFLVVSPLN